MKKNVALFDSSDTGAELLVAASAFKKMKQQNEWLVNYYVALAYLSACFDEKEENQEELCDTAEVFVNKADSLSKDNSEIQVLRSMLASSRIMADPMGRWMKYGKLSYDALAKAISLDENNPRPYVLKAISAMYTPGGVGGGCEKAMDNLNKANERFKTFKPVSDLHPHWGHDQLKEIKTECDKK